MTWQFALDLFEAKLSLGEKTVVVGIALTASARDDETGEMSRLLYNTFDAFLEGMILHRGNRRASAKNDYRIKR
jgi:hypothetical protein